jgi:hypothetical protein
MKILSKSVFELAAQNNINEKHTKLLILCLFLLFIKFLVMPIVEWQLELKEATNFYKLQYRDENSIVKSSQQIEASKDKIKLELLKVKKLYSSGTVTSNQVRLNELIDGQIAKLGLNLSTKNSRKLYEKDGVITIEYLVSARGTAEPLQEFVYWLDSINPKVLIVNTRFSSSRGSAVAEVNLRFQQFILMDNINE